MKLYFAGNGLISEFGADIDDALNEGIKNILQSYWDTKNKPQDMIDLKNKCNFFMDSGAFSAFTQKKEISLHGYIKYLKHVKPNVYAGLDVVNNAVRTKENIQKMVDEGLTPIPTFHRGSDFEFLYDLVDNFDYIALGGMAAGEHSGSDPIKWLDRVWHQILKRKPALKVHGFACSGIKIMQCYPWESVDSTSWLAPVIFGRPIGGKSNQDILDEHKHNPEILHNKGLQRRTILKYSIKHFLKVESDINHRHDNISTFENLTQGDLFE